MLRKALPSRVALLLTMLVACRPENRSGPFDLGGSSVEPTSFDARASVFVFTRSDCPLANRYSPELRRLHHAYAGEDVRFWVVYPDPRQDLDSIRAHREEFHVPFEPLHDPNQVLVRTVGATISPEAAVFDGDGRLVYRGRIDDRFPDYGILRPPKVRDLDAAIRSVLDGTANGLTTTEAVGCYLSDLSLP